MEYYFEEMARQWSGIRQAYKAYRGAGTEVGKERFHKNLIKQLDYFFNKYPNPFGDIDPEFIGEHLSEGQIVAYERSDNKIRAEKARALLIDIDETLEHHRRNGADTEKLDRIRRQREQVAIKLRSLENGLSK